MPVLNNRHDNIKVFRPAGTKIATGTSKIPVSDPRLQPALQEIAVEIAFEEAWKNFYREHGHNPLSDVVIFEGTISHGSVSCSILVLPDE